MAHGDFVWCDLSAFNDDEAKAFYGDLFGWSFATLPQPDGSPYHIASTAAGECAALYKMPEKFRDMGLPSFWMSYIQVDDIDRAVEGARDFGGKVEFGPAAFGDAAAIALIRDPLGAGFTAYQGDDLRPRSANPLPGHMAWNALHVSDANTVTRFYETIFDWRISRDRSATDSYDILNAGGEPISAIYEQSDEARGGYEYWSVYFCVDDRAWARARLIDLGGKILAESTTPSGPVLAAQDRDGAAFFMV